MNPLKWICLRTGLPPRRQPRQFACTPQAWAAGSAFMLLQACLGLSVDFRRGIRIRQPRLPAGVDLLTIGDLQVGGVKHTLTFQRVGPKVVVFSDQHFNGAVPLVTS